MMRTRVREGGRLGVVLLATLAFGVAACGGDDDGGNASDSAPVSTAASQSGGGTDTTAPAEAFDPNATLKVAFNLTGSSIGELDPTKSATPTNFDLIRPVYDTLLRDNGDGTYSPQLAGSVKATDPTHVEIVLQDGVEFSDGTPFDAEAVKAGLERNVASQGRSFKPEFFNVASIDVTSPTSLRVNLSAPVSGSWSILMAAGESLIVSPKAVADGVDLSTTPVGAGPFMVDRFDFGQTLRLTKNPNYFRADEIKLAGIEFIHVADPAAGQTALLSGAADLLRDLPFASIEALGNNPSVTVVEGKPGSVWTKLDICKANPPFGDERVRLALSLAIDRDAINDRLFAGKGEPVTGGFFPKGNPFHNPDVEQYLTYDVDRAKQLLAEAGYPDGFSFEAFSTPGDTERVMEVVQQQWQAIGVDMQMAPTVNLFDEFLQNPRRPMAGYGMQYQGIGKFTVNTVTGGVNNVCDYSDPNLDQAAADLAAADQATPSQEAVQLWQQAAEIYYSDVLSVNVLFTPIQAGVSSKLGGVTMLPRISTGAPEPYLPGIYVKA